VLPNIPEPHLTHPFKAQPQLLHPVPIGGRVSSSSGWVGEMRDGVRWGVRRTGRGRGGTGLVRV